MRVVVGLFVSFFRNHKMPRFKGRRKPKQSVLEQIGPALLPAAALTAVPAFGPSLCPPEGRPLTLALNVFSTVTPSTSVNDGLDEASGYNGEGSGDHEHDSFHEDDDIEEEGAYSTVVQVTRANENRKSYSDRERVPTPPTLRNVATVGHVTQSGDVYHILEPDEADPIEMDIYTLPVKGKGTGKRTVENQEEEDASSLDRTQQDVRRAMQAVHDMPVEETMRNLSENRQALGSNLGSSSGRGTMWQDDDEDSDEESEEPPPLPPHPVDLAQAPEVDPEHASRSEASPAEASPAEASPDQVSAASPEVSEIQTTVRHVVKVEAAPKHEAKVKEVAPVVVKQKAHTPRSAGSGAASSLFTVTPRDASSLSLETEVKQTEWTQTKEVKPTAKEEKAKAKAMAREEKLKAKEAKSMAKEAKSMAKKAKPMAEEAMPMAKEATPTAGEAKPMAKEAIPSLQEDLAGQGNRPASAKSKGGSISSAGRSATPRDAAQYLSLHREVQQVKGENHTLHQEVATLKKMVSAVTSAGEEGRRSSRQSPVVDELKNENEVLKNAVGRLNQELSQYQAAFRPLSEDDQSKLQAFPKKGPVPAWLINKRYLSPLFLAYDDLIQEKEEVIRRCQAQLQTLKQQTEDVVRENQRYQHRESSGGAMSMGVICASDWQALQDQARLVLEENQILTEQVDLQHRKVKDLCSSHTHEVGRLTKKLSVCEQDREEVEGELEETRRRLMEVKQRHDRLQLEAVTRTSMHDHINSVAGLQRGNEHSSDDISIADSSFESGSRSVLEEREQFEKEKESLVGRLMASDDERNRQSMAAIEVGAENKRLKAELSAMQSAVRRSQTKLVVLQKAIQQSESKELLTQNELANLIKMVEKTILERDTAFRAAREKQRDCHQTVNQIVNSSLVLGKMEEKLKMYKLRASAKLQTVSDKLKEQDDLFNEQRQEYEREIYFLRSLVKEKEERIGQIKGEKRDAEDSLEVAWQAARSENQALKDTLVDSVHKLRQHPALHAALDEEEDLEKLLYFSA